jgi:hypothetical protein
MCTPSTTGRRLPHPPILNYTVSFSSESDCIVTYLVTIDAGFGFIGLFEAVTTINYSAIANSHTSQFTIARTKTSQSVFSIHSWSPSIVCGLSSPETLRTIPAVALLLVVTHVGQVKG